jgi:hypothetical protein
VVKDHHCLLPQKYPAGLGAESVAGRSHGERISSINQHGLSLPPTLSGVFLDPTSALIECARNAPLCMHTATSQIMRAGVVTMIQGGISL